MSASPSNAVRLASGEIDVGLVPAIGGSVAHFRWRGIDLMRPLAAADARAGNVLGVACFPMVPYANRIAGNAFTFEGRTWRFAPNNPPERFNVHGTGWQRGWTLESADASTAVLALTVQGAGEPYAYRATQHFSVADDALSVRLEIANLGAARAPFGFGLHPWFERDADTELKFSASRFYREKADGVSGDPMALPPALDFAGGRRLPGGWLNNDFGGWSGVAAVRYPSRGAGLAITADPVFGHLMVYADAAKPFFCVEPQSNASGAFNRAEGFTDPAEGVIVLAPGESASGTIRFRPFPI